MSYRRYGEFRSGCRSALAAVTRRMPRFRGLGRFVLAVDRLLTCEADPSSFVVEAAINRDCRFQLDLRGREQKFAYYYGVWEEPLIRAVERNYVAGAFYDVGASIGLYTAKFGRLCRARGGVVRAFEPVKANVERLRLQLTLNSLDAKTVCIEEMALGDRESTVELVLLDGERPGNAKVVAHGNCQARQTTLDAVWHANRCESIGFIKIDTEGWDAYVIDGGRQAIATCRPNLLVEFNRERMRNLGIPIEPMWQFLVNDLEYTAYRVDHRGRQIRITAPQEEENVLFIRGEEG